MKQDIEAPLDYYAWVGLLTSGMLLCVIAPDFVTNAVQGKLNIALLTQSIQQKTKQVKAVASDLTALRTAIIGQESGGDPHVVNAIGATGLAQVMPENIPVWTEEALGRSLTPEQFRLDKTVQLKVIDHKLGKYLEEARKVTPDPAIAVKRVAAKWYSGDPSLFTNTRPQLLGPSIADYSSSVLNRYEAIQQTELKRNQGGSASY